VAVLTSARHREAAMRAIDHGDDRAVERELAAAERLLAEAPDTDRVRRERAALERVREALRMRDSVMARKRFAAQRSMSRRSFDTDAFSLTKRYSEKQEALQARRAARGGGRERDPDHGRLDSRPKADGPFDATVHSVNGAPDDLDELDVTRTDGSVAMLRLRTGDITEWHGDAIVNPTNPRLYGTGATVDGAVHRRGGMHLTRECRAIGHIEVGETAVTKGWDLPVAYVLHTASPVYDGTERSFDLLASCYRSSLELARQLRLGRIAFPAIGAGANGFRTSRAADVALREILGHLGDDGKPDEIDVVLYDVQTLLAYRAALAQLSRSVRVARDPA
jgi:O-acetyl-ADP-ribose deacetylase (regulator of RNase III)